MNPLAARRLDRVGALLLGLAATWTVVSALAVGGNPLPPLAVMAAAATGLALGRRLATHQRALAVGAVALAAASVALVSVGRLAGSAGAPFLYGNANAAFFGQGAIAGLMLAFGSDRRGMRVAALVGAVVFALIVVLTGSLAGAVLLSVPAVATVIPLGKPVRLWVLAGAVAVVVAVGVTVTMAAGGEGGRRARAVPVERSDRLEDPRRGGSSGGLDGVRRTLWSDAYAAMIDHPITGLGPGRFAAASPTARSDRDLGWAHNEFLQQGAEIGAPGLVILVLAFVWGFGRLGQAAPDRVTALGAASLTALGLHASVDYVLHFPAIPVMAAVLIGAAQGRRPGETRPRPSPLLRRATRVAVLPLGLLSPRRPGDVVILLYHRIGRGSREIDLPVGAFEDHVAELAEREPVRALDEALSDGGGVVLSFDDGYRDFVEHALPVLVKHRVPAVLYLATGLVVDEGGDPGDGLTWKQLREVTDGGLVTVGSHTHGHANLGSALEPAAEEEMVRSKELIEDHLGVPCRHFAYPWGVGSPDAERVARRLFDSAALRWATNRAGHIDRYRLGRTPVLRSDGRLLFRAKVRGRLDGEALVYRLAGRGPWGRP